MIAVSAAADGEQAKTFVVQEYARLPDFGGVKDNVYFTFRQTGNYVAEIRFQDNDASAYDSTIENYDFDADKVISPAPARSEIEKLYAESPERFAAAADAANSVADYVEHTGTELSSLLVLDNNVLDGLCEKITKGYSAVAGYGKRAAVIQRPGQIACWRFLRSKRRHAQGKHHAEDKKKCR